MIVVADTKDIFRGAVASLLRGRGYGVIEAKNSADAIAVVREIEVNLVIADPGMSIKGSRKWVAAIKSARPGIRVMRFSIFHGPPEAAKKAAKKAGYDGFVSKAAKVRLFVDEVRKIHG